MMEPYGIFQYIDDDIVDLRRITDATGNEGEIFDQVGLLAPKTGECNGEG